MSLKMNFKWAQLVDLYLGRLLLKFVSLSPPLPPKMPINPELTNLLVIKFFGMGSILEATPLIKTLKQRYPAITLDILTFSENRQIANSVDLFQNVYTIDFRKDFFIFLKQSIRFILHYRKTYSLIIDLEFFANYSALMTKLLSSSYSMGFESFFPARNRCYSRTVIFDHSSHIRLVFLKFLDALSINRPEKITISQINIPTEKKSAVMYKFPSLNKPGLKIAININSSDLCLKRKWPEESFQKLIALMRHDHKDLQIYLIGGENDVAVVKSFYDSIVDKTGVHIMAGKLDVLEFSYALTKTSCLVSNDSGPVHIAEALNVRLVCFFGPETPNLYGPLSKNSLVFYKNLYCSPCLNIYGHKKNKCKDNICLKQISVEEVYKEMKTLLANKTINQAVHPNGIPELHEITHFFL